MTRTGWSEPDGTQTCPVVEYTFRGPREPALTNFHRADDIRASGSSFVRADEGEGYWIFTEHPAILEGLQRTDVFSSASVVPTDPQPAYKWIPVMLDPPEHGKWRTLLGGYFSPARVRGMQEQQRRFAGEMIDSLAGLGHVDLVEAFARPFPSSIFLELLGLPVAELPQFLRWEHEIHHQTPESDPDGSLRLAGAAQVQDYLAELIAERRASPIPGAEDVVSQALGWQIDGQPATDSDLLNCLLLLFTAGLDTVAAQLSYIFLHLATHDDDRRRLVAEPELVPHAVEEFLRVYSTVQAGRIATRDVEHHGCPVKAGDTVLLSLAIAGRSEDVFDDATRVDLDRENVKHISFGAGPHRCLGSHLARQELVVAVQEWHRRIPEYRLDTTPVEHGGGVVGLDALSLSWDVR